nr:unnamed protein product [Callosobruchus analis]
MKATHLPDIIGAIDCTNIAIAQTPIEVHNYNNRKAHHSKKVQIVTDNNGFMISYFVPDM